MSIQNMKLRTHEKGAVLIIGLIILTVLVIIGISAYNFTSMGEKVTGNQRNKEMSLQAAESALTDGEQWIKAQPQVSEAVDTCDTAPCNVYNLGINTDLHLKTNDWWQNNARVFSGALDEVSTPPYFYVEQHSFIPYELDPDARARGEGYYYYQITSHGTGADDTASTTLQSIYTVQYR